MRALAPARTVRARVVGPLVVGAALLAGGCSIPGAAGEPASTAAAAAPVRDLSAPSASARMVCAGEAQQDIAEALNITAQQVEKPSWVDHVYACRYLYPGGSFRMSVTELPDAAATTAQMDRFAAQLGRTQALDGLGEGAFVTTNGSVVVRKDDLVLLVDDTALPAQLADPPLTPGNVAVLVAKTVIGCWTGA